MKTAFLAACFAAGLTTAASAASFIALPQPGETFGDSGFNTLCAASDAGAGGAGNQSCEVAVGELRGGSGTVAGDWEVGVQSPPGVPQNVQQTAWGNGVANPFSFGYSAATNMLSLTAGGVTSTAGADLSGATSMFIRARSNDDARGMGSMALTGLSIGGMALPDVIPAAGGGDGAAYLQVFDIDWAADWVLEGVATLSWDGATIPSGSRLGANFKVTNLAPVPLPAAAWLLIGGVGVLAAASRRRRAA